MRQLLSSKVYNVKNIFFATAFISNWFIVDTAYARKSFSNRSNAAFSITTGYGLSTHKSENVSSNDTTTSLMYGIKFRAGRNGDIGIEYSHFSIPTAFELNSSEITTSFSDTTFTYNFWNLYLGAIIANTDIKVNSAGTDIFDGLGSGTGGAFGIDIPLGKTNKFVMDFRSISTTTLKHDSSSEISLGARTDANIMGKIALTKSLIALDVGIKYTSFAVTVNSETSTDKVYTTWLGISFNLNP